MCQGNDNGSQKHANDCKHHAPAKRLQERGPAEPDGTKRQAFAEPDNEQKRDHADDVERFSPYCGGKGVGRIKRIDRRAHN